MITEADDLYHEPDDDPYWNESTWFSISMPDKGIEGYIYNWHRPNMGLCCVGPTFWDTETTTIEDALHHDVHWIQHIPEGEFMDAHYPGGLTIERVVPGRSFRFTYDFHGCAFDLTYTAFSDAHQFGNHFEQPGRMTGTLLLNGEDLAVDCWAMRDRSWGHRDLGVDTPSGDYLWGIASEDEAFHVMSIWDGQQNRVITGYLLRDGEMVDLVSGRTWTEGRRRSLQADRIFIEAEDAKGRKLVAEGQNRNTMIWTMYPRMVCALGQTEWNTDSVAMWGEQQQFWSSTVARDLLRKER
ncbi:hypothetical protein ORI20_29020 [Mycobacterium sp. CVI_P3]|uniref:DUF7065 domain-containing protein n=1 Tax=Mycobacterium pinniadriaticum TaxID=2994102 RepID=A0ABT3SMI5_9MYCO|nr:hypothetical protein [Mycobacterium pinniadriaticum]MCX2934313.1 hypothetical protein [Mycobacterium pinniadriaticum]MCX2940736.1 hypothetical protein [Mycobacterium pinniadriaticum]